MGDEDKDVKGNKTAENAGPRPKVNDKDGKPIYKNTDQGTDEDHKQDS